MSRPLHDPALEEEILARIIEGETLRHICRDLTLKGRPLTHGAVSKWAASDTGFAERMRVARELQMWAWGDEIVDIADDARNDWAVDPVTGARRVDVEHINRSRLRVDTRKFLMMKVAARVFGDKLAIGGDDGAPPIRIQRIERVIVRAKPPDTDS